MNKFVTIPKEVAQAIGKVTNKSKRKFDLLDMTNWDWLHTYSENECHVLCEYFKKHPHEYISAIQKGYRVELTPKEKIFELLYEAKGSIEMNLGPDTYWKPRLESLEEVIKIMGWEDENNPDS